MSPMLYSEQDLVPMAGSGLPEDGPRLVEHWLSADSAGELHRRIHAALRGLGFDWMSCANVVCREGVPTTTRFFSGHVPPTWTRRYFGEGFYEVDPLIQRALASTLPFAWSVDEFEGGSRFPELLRSCGIGGGVLVVLPAGLRSNDRMVVSLSSVKTGREWMDDEVLGQSVMLALCLHELLTLHMSVADAPDRGVAVSPMRQEILRHLAQGQSNKQIAYRLELSPDTIKYHMRELRRHFKVRNRMQLVNSMMCRDQQ
jgi:DNA-binding CsgD family transcriptional regulator